MVFLDEPTTGLDPAARQGFWKLLLDLRRDKKSILLTTHYMDEAYRLCDVLILMKDGNAVLQGAPKEIVRQFVGQEVIEVSGIPIDELDSHFGERFTWLSPFGDGVLAALPDTDPNPSGIIRDVTALRPSRLMRRMANLEDVFLRLTGKAINR
jgi:lipooligosaccharide transport system ATP-binding protein